MRHVLLALAILSLGCSSNSTVEPIVDLTGSWTSSPLSGGISAGLVLDLSQRGGAISGTGTLTTWEWVDTARQMGLPYAASITGTYQAPTITMYLQYRVGTGIAALGFVGKVEDVDDVRGTLNYGGDLTGPVTFTRN